MNNKNEKLNAGEYTNKLTWNQFRCWILCTITHNKWKEDVYYCFLIMIQWKLKSQQKRWIYKTDLFFSSYFQCCPMDMQHAFAKKGKPIRFSNSTMKFLHCLHKVKANINLSTEQKKICNKYFCKISRMLYFLSVARMYN